LPDEVKSRIAAGEVVERPASVVKELVENALDAGARSVHVELASGGRELIRIADDGVGLDADDLAMAVRRHTTSKLTTADELYELVTFGFRGEALPAIASVSRLKITSRPRPCDEGWQINVTGGAESLVRPASGAFGTTVEVCDLFYNLPARLKFLKNPGAEASACTEMLVRLSLVRPDVAFALVQDGQEVFACPAVPVSENGAGPVAAFARRAKDVLGSVATKGLVEIDYRYAPAAEGAPPQAEPGTWPNLAGAADYRLFGLISSPAHTRPNRSHVYLSVNGRSVRDRTFSQAVVEAYRQWLPARRFPAAVLFLELPGTDVDINVHPSKAEVRFRYPSRVFSLVHHAVRALFAPTQQAAAAPSNPSASSPVPVAPVHATPAQQTFDLWQGARTVETQAVLPAGEAIVSPSLRAAEEKGAYFAPPTPPRPATAPTRHAPETDAPSARPGPEPAEPIPPFRILGQAGGSYIVYEDDEGLKILDQHAAHERVLFEQLVERARTGARADAQRLLLPESVELTPQQAAALADVGVRATIEELGFELADFGPRAVLVQAVPVVLKSQKAPQYVGEILDGLVGDLEGGRTPTRATLREKAAYVLSCKGAIKAGELLNVAQMNALLIEFFRRVARRGGTCPHGRPVAIEFSWEELERKVGR
jgi:DNA mismatch repair protein MutL